MPEYEAYSDEEKAGFEKNMRETFESSQSSDDLDYFFDEIVDKINAITKKNANKDG